MLMDLAIIAVCIVGIWRFRTPRDARFGNLLAAAAMLGAFFLMLYRHGLIDPAMVLGILLAGGLAGLVVSRKVTMLGMPSLVALQNGMGGLASLLVALVELTRGAQVVASVHVLAGVVGLTLGALTFSGSLIAAAKLSARMRQTPHRLPLHTPLTLAALSALLIVALIAMWAAPGPRLILLVVQIALAALFGILFSVRIGGADMPVLISFLNATTGLAAAFCGIVIENRLLIAFGAMVAASGSILTYAMCKAMNRSLLRVFVPQPAARETRNDKVDPAAGFGLMTEHDEHNVHPARPEPAQTADGPTDQQTDGQTALANGQTARPLTRAAELLAAAQKVVVIPGYGMALAQAQHKVVELANLLEEKAKQVVFAIHPVAGRMPGHMNVLLAEADVDYDALVELDNINPEFVRTDVALIFGACDVVNPAAIETEGTPISGMPILLAHEAGAVIVCNYDTKPGYSGVDNPLYRNDKAILLMGDAKETAGRLIEAVKSRFGDES
jgi:NAD(P) transhydrogenase subunit beta